MTKRLLGLAGLVLVCSVLSGCTAVKNYSIRSYQGTIPLNDYRYVNPESYGVPATTPP